MKVFLLTTGSGDDGDDWVVEGIYSAREKADRAKVDFEAKRHFRPDGSFYQLSANEIEVWPLDPGADAVEHDTGDPGA